MVIFFSLFSTQMIVERVLKEKKPSRWDQWFVRKKGYKSEKQKAVWYVFSKEGKSKPFVTTLAQQLLTFLGVCLTHLGSFERNAKAEAGEIGISGMDGA